MVKGFLWFLAINLLLPGCVVVPYPYEEPYQDSATSSVVIGETSRDQVVALFGDKAVSRAGDTIWVYGKAKRIGYEAGKQIGILDAHGRGTLWAAKFMVLEFDGDTVVSLEVLESAEEWSSKGICLAPPRFLEGPLDFSRDLIDSETVVASRGFENRNAQLFQTEAHSCSLYLYQEYAYGRAKIGTLPEAYLSHNTYIHQKLAPGSYEITATNHGNNHSTLLVDCLPGEIVFVRILSDIWRWSDPHLEQVDREEGRKGIGDRMLVLLP